MTTNIIELAPALLRRREGRQQAAQAVRQVPWRSRYRDGIDGLVIRRPTAEIIRLVPSAKLRTGETNHG